MATVSVYHAYGHLKISLSITALSLHCCRSVCTAAPSTPSCPPSPPRPSPTIQTSISCIYWPHPKQEHPLFSTAAQGLGGGTQLQVSSDTQLCVTPSRTLVSIWVPREGRAAIFLPGQCVFLCPFLLVFSGAILVETLPGLKNCQPLMSNEHTYMCQVLREDPESSARDRGGLPESSLECEAHCA